MPSSMPRRSKTAATNIPTATPAPAPTPSFFRRNDTAVKVNIRFPGDSMLMATPTPASPTFSRASSLSSRPPSPSSPDFPIPFALAPSHRPPPPPPPPSAPSIFPPSSVLRYSHPPPPPSSSSSSSSSLLTATPLAQPRFSFPSIAATPTPGSAQLNFPPPATCEREQQLPEKKKNIPEQIVLTYDEHEHYRRSRAGSYSSHPLAFLSPSVGHGAGEARFRYVSTRQERLNDGLL